MTVSSCVGSGSARVPEPTHSLAADTYWKFRGGPDIEARMSLVARRAVQHQSGLRHRARDPHITAAIESFLAHPSQGQP